MENDQIKKFSMSLTSTSTLPSEVSEVMRGAAIEVLKKVLGVRQYGQVISLGDPGMQTYQYVTYDALTAAHVRAQGASAIFDDADATKSEVSMEELNKAFKLSWEANALKKISMAAGQTRAAVQEIKELEDDKITDSLVTNTGNTLAGTDWSANTADPVQDVADAKDEIRADGYEADLLILNPTNSQELDSVIASNTWYSVTESVVRDGKVPRFMGLMTEWTTQQDSGTALVLKSGAAGGFEVAEAQPVSILAYDDKDDHVHKVQVYEKMVAAVVRPNAVCTITSI